MAFMTISMGSNLRSQSNDARDPFASPSPSPAEVVAESEVEKLRRIQSMLIRRGDEGMLSESRLKKRMDMIRTYPELGRFLSKIADDMIEQRSPEIGDVLDAMSMRLDVPPAATARYIELAKRIIEGKTAKDIKDRFEQEYLSGITEVLAAHLSSENEDLLIAMLHFGTKGHAHRALGRVGTMRSLSAMQKYADNYEQYARTQNDGSASLWLKEIKESLSELSRRVADTNQGTGATIHPIASKTDKTVEYMVKKSSEISPAWNIIMIVTIGSVLGGIFILASKRRKNELRKRQGK